MQKRLTSLVFLAGSLSLPAFAQISYQYTGNPFTYFSCGPDSTNTATMDCLNAPAPGNTRTSYTASDHVTATLTFTAPLAANLNYQDVRSLAGFQLTMNDGRQTLSTASIPKPVGIIARVSTDGSGQIIGPWLLVMNLGNAANSGIASENEPPVQPFVEDSGTLACCDPTVPGNLALNFSSAGTWMSGGGAGSSFPTGTFIRLTQLTICCSGLVVDNVDSITGGLGKALTYGDGGSTLGDNAASARFTPITLDSLVNPPKVTNNGPSVGAYSDSNQGAGFGRAIAFATFTNSSSTTMLRAHAVLNGEFLQDSFGLPNGILEAGAAIHVYDTDKFNAAISSATDGSDAAIGQFLLGGYTASAGRTPSLAIGNLDAVLSAALIGQDHKFYANGPFNPPAPIGDDLNALFTIPIRKNYTVVFDVVASGVVGGNPDWASGTGQVNFLDTLKPAPTFFTDANGNPVSGIGVVAPLPSLPPGTAALALAPATGSLLSENPYTVTATATDAGSKPVPGVGVKFTVTAGPNAGITGVVLTDPTGKAKFTFIGKGGEGKDTIQARIGTLVSNSVNVTWQAARCPEGEGFWKNHPNSWPVSSLTLGGKLYTKSQLLTILGAPRRGDASVILAVQLIAAKLDVANGSDPAPIRAVGISADTLLTGLSVPARVNPSSTAGGAMQRAAATLDDYASGELTPECTP